MFHSFLPPRLLLLSLKDHQQRSSYPPLLLLSRPLQFKIEDALGSLSKLQAGPQVDQLVFASFLIYKLSILQLLVARAKKSVSFTPWNPVYYTELSYSLCRVLDTCEVQLYRQMGGLRDDLMVHERALDVLIELMKKEQLDESVPLHGIEKGISHFEVEPHTLSPADILGMVLPSWPPITLCI